MPHETVSVLIRWVHVAAMAVVLGGALLVWAMSLRVARLDLAEHGRLLMALAERYERLFWLALGLLVMTGLGNLGAFGAALPAPATAWGGRLGLKLICVLVLFIFSLVRTLVVTRLGLAAESGVARMARLFPALYGGTALGVGAIVLLAVVLAHA